MNVVFYFPLFAVFIFIYLFYYYVVHPAIISPLSKIPPGHPTASFLPLWIWWKRRIGLESRTIGAAHQRLGPVVRLAPNEVSVASLDGLRKIYVGGFNRTEWFLQFSNFDGTPNLASMLHSNVHTTRRRSVSNIYSKSYLFGSSEFQKLAKICVLDRLLPVLEEAARADISIDIYSLGCGFGAEFFSGYAFGSSFGLDLVRRGREDERERFLKNDMTKLMGWKGAKLAAKKLENQLLQMCMAAEKHLKSRSSDVKDGKLQQIESEVLERTSTYPVVYAQLIGSIRTKENISDPQDAMVLAASEIFDNTEASTVGVGIAVTYAIHELSRRPTVQNSLRRELAAAELPLKYPSQQQSLSTMVLRKLDALPILDSLVMETLRRYTPVPGPLRRYVPKGGTTIDGYFIPAGVTISSSSYALHRQKDVYPQAESWQPERWTSTTDSTTIRHSKQIESDESLENVRSEQDLRRWFWPFGSGGRMCIGNHFAMTGQFLRPSVRLRTSTYHFIEIKLLLASVYLNYNTTIIDDFGIQQMDAVVGAPVGLKLVVGLSRVADD